MKKKIAEKIGFSWRDTMNTLLILGGAMVSCVLLSSRAENTAYASLIFVLAVFLISRITEGYFYGAAASVVSVFGVNYAFTYPYMALDFTLAGYPLTFMTMMFVAVATSMMTTQLKEREQLRAMAEQEKLRGNLLRSVSHDLRTPLTSIIGAADLLLADESIRRNPEQRELAEGISQDGDWLLRMVENMLSITRLESGAQLHLQAELPEEIIGAAAAKFKKWHPDHKLRIIFPKEVLMAQMDGVLIEQVILNFLDNAARHAGSSEPIVLECGRRGEELFVSVTDFGRGLGERELNELFSDKPGQTKNTERPDGDTQRGMGIGLSVCRTIIRAHSGTIAASNHAQGGAVFEFTLPLLEVEHEQ